MCVSMYVYKYVYVCVCMSLQNTISPTFYFLSCQHGVLKKNYLFFPPVYLFLGLLSRRIGGEGYERVCVRDEREI